MSKKMMLIALPVAALLAIPSAAWTQEIHFSGATTFFGSGSAASIAAFNEPKISCTSTAATGSFTAGSSTTGEVKLTFTGCTAEFLGVKGNCNTTGDAAQTITSSGVFHLITTNTSKPGFLLTPVTTTILCLGFSRVEITGNGVIGTIISPACGASSSSMWISFGLTAGGPTQKDIEYTGGKYDLSADTENSEGGTTGTATAGLQAELTLNSGFAGTLECT